MAHLVFLSMSDLATERIGWVLVILGLQLAVAGRRMRRSAATATHRPFAVLPGRREGPVPDRVRDRALRD